MMANDDDDSILSMICGADELLVVVGRVEDASFGRRKYKELWCGTTERKKAAGLEVRG